MKATGNIVQEIASSEVILTEIMLYCVVSLLIFFLMDLYAARKLGSRAHLGYQALRGIRGLSLIVIFGFTALIAGLCLMKGFTCTRGTMSYFGLPYLVALTFCMVNTFRRVYAETKARRL